MAMRMRMIKRMNYRGKGMDDKYQGIQSLSLISYFLCFGALDWCAWLNLEADSENIKKLAPCMYNFHFRLKGKVAERPFWAPNNFPQIVTM